MSANLLHAVTFWSLFGKIGMFMFFTLTSEPLQISWHLVIDTNKILGLGAHLDQVFVVNRDSGENNGNCSISTPCEDLFYAIEYVNNQSYASTDILFFMDSNNGTSFQKWNNTLVIYETNSSYLSTYNFSGESAFDTTIEWVQSSQSTYDAAIYCGYQYGVSLLFEDFKLVPGDSTSSRKFIYSYDNYNDSKFTFSNVIFDGLVHDDYFIDDRANWYAGNYFLFEDCIVENVDSNAYYWVYQSYSGGVSMENIIWRNNSFSSNAIYSFGRYETLDGNNTQRYLKNIKFISNNHFANYFVYDLSETFGRYSLENLYFEDHNQS